MLAEQRGGAHPPLDPALSAMLMAGINRRIDQVMDRPSPHGFPGRSPWHPLQWIPLRGLRIGLTLVAVAAAVIIAVPPQLPDARTMQLERDLQGAVSVLDAVQLEELEQSMLLDVRTIDALSAHVAQSLDSVQVDENFMAEVFGDLSPVELQQAGRDYLASHDVLSTFDETSLSALENQ